MSRNLLLFVPGRNSAPILFSQRDDFITPLPAGSVNGTPAEPGSGTRVVIDTENKLSISATGLTFSGGKAVADFGDPAYWLGAEARLAGKIMLVSILTSPINSRESFFGWTTAQNNSGFANIAGVVYLGSGNNVVVYDVGNGYNAVGAWQVGTTYRFWLVLRAAGAFVFAQGGAFGSEPTLILASKTANGATVYPSLNNYNAAYSATTIRVPVDTYLPIPLLSDGFNRANGAAGISDGAGNAEANGGSGVVWVGTGAAIDTNALKITPTEGAELASGALTVGTRYKITATQVDHFYTGCAIDDTFRATVATALDANNKVVPLSNVYALTALNTANVYGEMALPAFTEKTQCGFILRADSTTNPQNFIICYRDGQGKIQIDECVAGVYSNLGSAVNAFAANEEWRVLLHGDNIRLHKHTTRIADLTTTVLTGNIHGVFSTNAASRFDSVVIWPAGTEGQHAVLNSFFSGITTKTFLAIGDSKTACTSGIRWEDDMSDHSRGLEFLELSPRIAGDGWRVTSPDIDFYLAQVNGIPDYAFINFGVNDLGVTSEAAFKAAYLNILDKIHAKYPNTECYLDRIWMQAVDQTNVNLVDGWINDIISLRSAFAFAGPDERIYLENGDDGATYMAVETPRRHPNDAGYTLMAAKKRAATGF